MRIQEDEAIEAIEPLLATCTVSTEGLSKVLDKFNKIESQLEDANKVIEFYADTDKWNSSESSDGKTEIWVHDQESVTLGEAFDDIYDFCTDIYGGKMAREYLAKYQESK